MLTEEETKRIIKPINDVIGSLPIDYTICGVATYIILKHNGDIVYLEKSIEVQK